MAKPRVFVSSTFYDLKHIRSSLDIFIESLGFEPILSEKGDIAYSPDHPLDESCYREVQTSDIFVLIIGGRYGLPKEIIWGHGGLWSDNSVSAAAATVDRDRGAVQAGILTRGLGCLLL
jgi:hypothetical protein